jgi:hypothetical protein
MKLGEDSMSPYTYEWNEVPLGAYRITARAMRNDGIAGTSSVDIEITSSAGVSEDHPSLRLRSRVYPNPFGGVSTMEFFLSRTREVELEVYDLSGRRLERVYRGVLGEGNHALSLDAAGYSPGLYFYRLRAGRDVSTGKLLIVR